MDRLRAPIWYAYVAYTAVGAVGKAALAALATLGLHSAGRTTAALATAALGVAWEALALRRVAVLTHSRPWKR